MSPAEILALILSFPDTEPGTSYGYPSFKTAGKFFTRIRAEDDSVVVYLDSIDQRDMLIEAEPETFHLTDHYRAYAIVLARVSLVDPDWLRHALDARWRKIAPRKSVKAREALQSADPTA